MTALIRGGEFTGAEQLGLDELHPQRNVVHPGLRVGRFLTLDERFDEWASTADGETVYGELVRRAFRLRERGFPHYGVGAIVESIRFDRNVEVGPDGDLFKVNNSYRSRLARKAMREYDELDGFFETRELRS